LSKIQRGTSYPAVRNSDVFGRVILLPSLPEQHRIVAKIEELFTKLDAGVEALKQVQAQLKRYRQSVLKSAVEGKLTAEWREQNKDELEPADKLLERILKERREKWEAEQLANYKAKGKKPPNNWQSRYKEPVPPDTNNLSELPEGWVWSRLGQILVLFSSFAFKSKEYTSRGIPILRMGNIQKNFTLTFSKRKQPYLPKSRIKEFRQYLLEEGDVVMTLTDLSGGGKFLGTVAKLKSGQRAFLNQRVSKVTISDSLIKDFVFFSLQSPLFRNYMVTDTTGSLQRNTNHNFIYDFCVPLPPLNEQKNIVVGIERFLSIIDQSEMLIALELNRSQSLRQSILKRAFEGKLVPQDPNDEPASVLLERIKAEKTKAKKSK